MENKVCISKSLLIKINQELESSTLNQVNTLPSPVCSCWANLLCTWSTQHNKRLNAVINSFTWLEFQPTENTNRRMQKPSLSWPFQGVQCKEGFKENGYIYKLIHQVQLNWLHSIKLLIIKADVDYDKKNCTFVD